MVFNIWLGFYFEGTGTGESIHMTRQVVGGRHWCGFMVFIPG